MFCFSRNVLADMPLDTQSAGFRAVELTYLHCETSAAASMVVTLQQKCGIFAMDVRYISTTVLCDLVGLAVVHA